MADTSPRGDVREEVRVRCAARARLDVRDPAGGCGGGDERDPVSRDPYDPMPTGQLPLPAVRASLGCGNPVALAEPYPCETVLDPGTGGGIDVLLAAERVGPQGFVQGFDMTDEMLALAEQNRIEAGVRNAILLEGHIEDVPLPDCSVDVSVSDCVINLSPDKARAS